MDKMKYQLDMLTAYNEALCNSDRMYKMIALSTGGIYYYRNFKRNITELIGPWEKYLGYKPDGEEFIINDISSFISREDFERFLESIPDMDKKKLEYTQLKLAGTEGRIFKCIGSVYYDSDGDKTDMLIGLIEEMP